MDSNACVTIPLTSRTWKTYCLSRTQSMGLLIGTACGVLSLTALCFVIVLIIRRNFLQTASGQHFLPRSLQPTDLLILSLFFAEIFQGIGSAMSIRWLSSGRVEAGRYCTAQGVVSQFGEVGVALSTLLIAIYTGVTFWFPSNPAIRKKRSAAILLFLCWMVVIILVAVGNGIKRGPGQMYYSPTPFWCWIGAQYIGWRLWGEYVWFFITLGTSTLVYLSILADHVRNKWAKNARERKPRGNGRSASNNGHRPEDEPRPDNRLYLILAYPAMYMVNILPMSVIRWYNKDVPASATFSVAALFFLSGFFNVILLLWTRPDAELFRKPPNKSKAGQSVGFPTSDNMIPPGFQGTAPGFKH